MKEGRDEERESWGGQSGRRGVWKKGGRKGRGGKSPAVGGSPTVGLGGGGGCAVG